MQLHELENLEDALKFENPLRLESEKDFDPIARDAICAFVNSCVDDLEYFLGALHSHFCNKALVILEDLDSKLLWFAAAFRLDFADSELHAGEAIGSKSVLDL